MGKIHEKRLASGTQLVIEVVCLCVGRAGVLEVLKKVEKVKLSLRRWESKRSRETKSAYQACLISSTPMASATSMLLVPRPVPPAHACRLSSRPTYLTDQWLSPLGDHTGVSLSTCKSKLMIPLSQTRSSVSVPDPRE